jgi:hypothetical protein
MHTIHKNYSLQCLNIYSNEYIGEMILEKVRALMGQPMQRILSAAQIISYQKY